MGQNGNLASTVPSGLAKLGRVELCRWGQAEPSKVERGLGLGVTQVGWVMGAPGISHHQ